jgi:hypothetical protein
VRRSDGREVARASRQCLEPAGPSSKDYLLSSGYAGDEEDAFDRALRDVRRDWPPLLYSRRVLLEDED